MQALRKKWCTSFWASTGAYDAVASYINMNYGGLKDNIITSKEQSGYEFFYFDATLATMQNALIIRRLAVATVVARVARETGLLPLRNALIVSV